MIPKTKKPSEPPSRNENPLRVLAWGTFDLGKPRVRILLDGCEACGVTLTRCHHHVWRSIEDKTEMRAAEAVRAGIAYLRTYPRLLVQYLLAPKQDVVFLGYLGHLDVLLLWPWARLRKEPIVWDAFISLYQTVVFDRQFLGPSNPAARMLYLWEWLACRSVDIVLVDTEAHADYFRQTYGLPPWKVVPILVGAEVDLFRKTDGPCHKGDRSPSFTVFFYGTFIPLHNASVIVQAARLCRNAPIRWVLVGKGQQSRQVRDFVAQHQLTNVEFLDWIPYEDLIHHIQDADVCLGIFGAGQKAQMVIPNKVFQIIAAGKPVITADTPAIRELVAPGLFVHLIPTNDPEALAAKVMQLAATDPPAEDGSLAAVRDRIHPNRIGAKFADILGSLRRERRS